MYEEITYIPETGKFYKKGKEVGWKNSKGYVFITISKNETLRAHRLAWFKVYGEFPKKEIDHINGDRADNRIENLRDVTRIENMHNLKFHRDGNTPCIKKRWNKYAVYIKGKYKGLFNTKEEAEKAFYKISK